MSARARRADRRHLRSRRRSSPTRCPTSRAGCRGSCRSPRRRPRERSRPTFRSGSSPGSQPSSAARWRGSRSDAMSRRPTGAGRIEPAAAPRCVVCDRQAADVEQERRIVATETTPDFDLGPLSWVQGGDRPGARARPGSRCRAFRTPPHDAGALKHARTHVHQAAGAIQMVGLDAVVAYTDEIERQLAGLDDLADPATGVAVLRGVDRACRKLQIFLAEVVNGAPPAPLRLFPEYEAMQRARGIRVVAPTRPVLSLTCPRGRPPARTRTRCRRPGCIRTSSGSAVPTSGACSSGCAAKTTAPRDARSRRRHRRCNDLAAAACLLVDDRRRLRRGDPPRARCGLRRQAARRAHRPAGPARRRGFGQGGRPACGARCSTTWRSARR